MKFFIPSASSDAHAESVLSSIAKRIGASIPTPQQRIFKLSYSHNARDFDVEVGKRMPRYYQEGDQEVIAILGHDPFFICLPKRGAIRGDPILVAASSVHHIALKVG